MSHLFVEGGGCQSGSCYENGGRLDGDGTGDGDGDGDGDDGYDVVNMIITITADLKW